ncbi:dual specificity protein phosphatase 7 [Dermacentor albipictus]|uniref:dual specificity protein phosphatase 7 n=1 Tax=Dermacentor albipictus TaxID=60249 RepID=UPI0031FC3314
MPSRELSTSVMSGSCPTVGPDWVAARVREPAAPESALLLLDCRPPDQFARCRLRGALGVSLPASLLVLRRLSNGKLCVSSVLRDARQRDAFEACYRQLPIVLYDADGSYADVQVTGVLVQRLRQDGCQVSCLQGGFSEFHSRYPEWCDSGEPQEPGPGSSSPPGSAANNPGPVSVTTTRALLGLETLRISTECGSPKDPRDDPDRCDSGLARDDSPGGADPPFPVQIVPFLYLGNEENSLDLDSLERHNIRYVLNVTHNLANAFEGRGLKYMKIPIEDHWSQNLASFFPQAIAFIDEARQKRVGVLVHCLAGVSRSVTVTLAYLMQKHKLPLNEAYDLVKKRKANIAPNFNFLGQLLDFEQLLDLRPQRCGCCHTPCRCRRALHFTSPTRTTPDSGIDLDRWT